MTEDASNRVATRDGRAESVGPKDRLHQIRLQYDGNEDRLMLRVSTVSRREFRIWITRRLLARLWPVLVKGMEAELAQQSAGASREARQAMLAMRSEAAAQAADFETRYRDSDLEPVLGPAPMLPSRLQWAQRAGGGITLVFHDPEGRTVPLSLGGALIHNLVRLLRQVTRKAAWGLDLPLPALEPSATADGAVH